MHSACLNGLAPLHGPNGADIRTVIVTKVNNQQALENREEATCCSMDFVGRKNKKGKAS